MISPIRAAVCAVIIMFLFGACSGGSGEEAPGPRFIQPGAPGETSRVLDPDETPEVHVASHTEADVAFVHAMIAHHAQALDMTVLVPDRTGREDVPLFAERIELSQQDEIDWMLAWLEERDESLPDHAGHDAGDHAGMPGMLTDEQLAMLEAARGEEFDRLFLEFMYYHHLGAVQMVQDLLDSGHGQEPELWRFVNHIDSDQSIELGRIEMILADMDAGDG